MQLHTVHFRAMGSPCSIRLYAPSAAQAKLLAEPLIAEVERLEQAYSRYLPTSILSAINVSAGRHEVVLDEETSALMHYAYQAWQQSEGLFDITSGVLRKVWDFHSQQLPSQLQIDAILPLIGMEKLEWIKRLMLRGETIEECSVLAVDLKHPKIVGDYRIPKDLLDAIYAVLPEPKV